MPKLPWLLPALIFLVGCGSQPEQAVSPSTVGPPVEVAGPLPPPSAPPPPEETTPNALPDAGLNRQLVYNAELDLKVKDLPRAISRVDSLVQANRGWTQTATQTRTDDEWRQETTIRVRPAQVMALLSRLSTLGTVERKSLTSEDVTAEHADVTARLRNKRLLEQRYLALLQQAHKVSDVLEVEAKVGAVREEIEAVESRLKVLNDEVAFSTITLKLYQPLVLSAPDAPVISFGSRLLEAVYGGWELTASLVVGILYLWPIWVLLGVGLVLWRTWRRRRLS
ncbi:DUF4349 domain-containing protein [Hymenobacter sp. GOD-10R]|uniref:DUF4349 domain-containing protein n=1 Tax=Hymenobacter sp. GOD-10R TaxID=3093922 RepID=UPI002D766FF6|nr:DUF4349 domain-containing protein [Hymenobacter sp. GOD-10R]WRQ31128.1 DUF4349 domain-containing protein [Hymenobacter sp. GOD-10R]